MKKVLITINREYGSGGRIIGEKVAQALSIPFYNHNLIDMIAHESGMDKAYIEKWQERISSPALWGVAPTKGSLPVQNYYTNEAAMYEAQSKIVQEVAAKGSCVIVGRCADYLLHDRKESFHVFIYADKQVRIRRSMEEYGMVGAANTSAVINTIDKNRAMYYRKHTMLRWGDYRNYHLMLDSGFHGVEACASIIIQATQAHEAVILPSDI